jgi:hypothetical protein
MAMTTKIVKMLPPNAGCASKQLGKSNAVF